LTPMQGQHPNYGGGDAQPQQQQQQQQQYMQQYMHSGYLSARPGYPPASMQACGQMGGMAPMHPMGMHPGMAAGNGNGVPANYSNGSGPMPNGMQPMSNGMNPYSQQFMPSQAYAYEQPAAPIEQPPTDEEQEWLEQQMARNPAPEAAQPDEDVAATMAAEQAATQPTSQDTPAPAAAQAEGDYDDVMKMIEENRRRNEAKRAAQSARNAEIIAAYEARVNGGAQQG